MLDELPSLELAATAVAIVLTWRAVVLARGGAGLARRPRRLESARARDLIGIVLLGGAVLYAVAVQRASAWFLLASGLAAAAQLAGFYFRAAARTRAKAPPTIELHGGERDEDDEGEEDDVHACPRCGHGTLIELSDTTRLLGGLSALSSVVAWICPHCGDLSGHVEEPHKISIGPDHGTTLRQSLSGADDEALEEPTDHDG